MGAQNKDSGWKNVVGWIAVIIIFFACDGLQTTARLLDFFNAPVPEVLVSSQPKQKSEAELKKQQLEEEREKIIMQRAKEDNLNPVNVLKAYKTAKYLINKKEGWSEEMLHYVLTENDFSDAEAKNAIAWLVNYREVDFFEEAYLAAQGLYVSGSRLTEKLELMGFTKEQCIYARKKRLKVNPL